MYQQTFKYHFLFNQDGYTLLAATQREPTAGNPAFAYVLAIDNFMKIEADSIVAKVKLKQYKSKL